MLGRTVSSRVDGGFVVSDVAPMTPQDVSGILVLGVTANVVIRILPETMCLEDAVGNETPEKTRGKEGFESARDIFGVSRVAEDDGGLRRLHAVISREVASSVAFPSRPEAKSVSNGGMEFAIREVGVAGVDLRAVPAAADGDQVVDVSGFVIAEGDDFLELATSLGADSIDDDGGLVLSEALFRKQEEDRRLEEGAHEELAADRLDDVEDPFFSRREIVGEEAHVGAWERHTRIRAVPVLDVVFLTDEADPLTVFGILNDGALQWL